MTHEYEMVDQNILLYEARLKHIDEFCTRAERLIPQHPEIDIHNQLAPIKLARERLVGLIQAARLGLGQGISQKSTENNYRTTWDQITKELDALLKDFEALFSKIQT